MPPEKCQHCPEFFGCPLVQPGEVSRLLPPVAPEFEGLLVAVTDEQGNFVMGLFVLPL